MGLTRRLIGPCRQIGLRSDFWTNYPTGSPRSQTDTREGVEDNNYLVSMSSKSRLSVRIRGISHSTGIDVLKAVANEHCFASKRTTSSSATTTSQPVVSLAADIDGSKVGTISFPSEDIKDQALRHHAPDWKWDDDFSEMTLLRTPEAADLEYVKARSLISTVFVAEYHSGRAVRSAGTWLIR
jgi:hypothetical protein